MKKLSFANLPAFAIADGATTPNPGFSGVWAWSTTLSLPVLWDGTKWSDYTPGANTVVLASDVTNNNATANTIADVTGLSFPVTAGQRYKFKFFITYSAAATTTGSRWSINGPATTLLAYRSDYSLTATSRTFNNGQNAYNLPAAANATSAVVAAANMAVIEGMITPSASGTVIARFASSVLSSAIVAKAGQSYVEYSTY